MFEQDRKIWVVESDRGERVNVEKVMPDLYTCWRHKTVASRGKRRLLEVECKQWDLSGDPLQASGKRGRG
jgi:hypothetical protein